jgi:hypothetical protein
VVTESLTFQKWTINNVAIGCAHAQTGNLRFGIMGLSNGPLSFATQMTPLTSGKFSYCLSRFESTPLIFGEAAVPPIPKTIFTSILKNPKNNLYYVDLLGITIAGKILPIPPSTFRLQDEGGGVIIDSGTTFTHLVDSAYIILRDAFRKHAKLGPLVPVPLALRADVDTCYNLHGHKNIQLPSIHFHFADGALLELKGKNIVERVTVEPIYCLTFARSNSNINIIGNRQQRGFRVSYDIPNARLGFTPNQCN